jgi:hypothetical protein
MKSQEPTGVLIPTPWMKLISTEEERVYVSAIKALEEDQIPFALGGGFALSTYTTRWRNTKDIDFFILPRDRVQAAESLSKAGFKDYFSLKPYDRGWIYRSCQGDVIIDLIWSMANQRKEVDELCFLHAPRIEIFDHIVPILSPEELLWWKLYVLQRDRCDWPDIINLIYAVGPCMDWNRLIERVGDDLPLVQALLQVFNWVCPERAGLLPRSLRNRFHLADSSDGADALASRVKLIDNRSWFAAFHPEDEPLRI